LSLRLRLALLYTLLLAGVLAVFGALTFVLVSKRLYAAVDEGLRAEAEAVEQAIGPGDGPLTSQRVLESFQRLSQLANELATFYVLDPSGQVLYSSVRGPALAPLPRPQEMPGYVTYRSHGQGIRLYLDPVVGEDGQVLGAVEVGQSLRATDGALSEIRNVIALGGAVALALTAGSSYLLAGRALAPVRRLAALARYIERTGDFRRRLPEPATRGEPKELVSTFNAMIERVERTLRLQAAFLADSSHELRRPLTVIRTDIDVLRSDSLPPEEQRACLDEMAAEAEAMGRLIADLLFLSREGEQAIEREPVDLSDLCREVVDRYREQADGHVLVADIEDGLWASGDRQRLAQMLTNLLENALDYTPAGGEVCVSLSRSGAWAELRVSDTGIGIPPEELPQVFDRFFRGREARAMRPQGSGLGLAIVRHVAEVHGGEVRAESEPGRGTTFTVRLPLLAR